MRQNLWPNALAKLCGAALGLRNGKTPVILVTKDIVVRVKAQMLGIQAEDFTTEQAPVSEEQYTGRCEVFVAEKKFEDFKKKHITPEDVYQVDEAGEKLPVTLMPNQFVILKADQSARKTQLGRFDGKKIVPLSFHKKKPYGVSPRNVGQKFLQEALMADAEGAPLLRPVVDNLELLVDQNEKERFADERSLSGKVEELFDRGIVDAQALNFIRGRSISKTYLVIDESQNLTPKQAKGIITRAGMDTKIILLGDPQQIDHPLLDERTNGLSYAAEKMKGSPLCWQVTMSAEECERSVLATDAVKRM